MKDKELYKDLNKRRVELKIKRTRNPKFLACLIIASGMILITECNLKTSLGLYFIIGGLGYLIEN